MMSPADLATLDTTALRGEVDGARDALVAARLSVAHAVTDLAPRADDMADALMDTAEEFGSAHAVLSCRQSPAAFGDAPAIDDATGGVVESALERWLEARDRLDRALAEREARQAASNPRHAKVVAVDGRECALTDDGLTLAALDGAERFPLDDLPRGGRAMTLSEQVRYATDTPPMPSPSEPRAPRRER